MAYSQQHSLPPDVQENIVHNIQKIFPNHVDTKVIRAVLNRECWDLEKSLAFLKSGLQNFNENPKNVKKKEYKSKQTNQIKSYAQKNKPGNNNKTVGNKPPELIKNFKKKAKPKKGQQQNSEKPKHESIVQGGWVMVDDFSSPTGKVDVSKTTNMDSSVENKSQTNDNRLAKRKRMIQNYEIIKQFGEPLNRISAYINEGIRVMILLRGCSGSGKTTYAGQLLKKHGAKHQQSHVFSTDNFYINKEGKYNFHYDLLQVAHEWNQKLVRLAVSEGRSPIFVDNTNTRLWEMKEYACLAVEFGYVVETLEPPTPWFFNEDMLIKKTLHNVPRDTIKKMLERYEANISGEDVLRSLQIDYGSLAPPQGTMAGLDTPISKKHLKLYNERFNIEIPNKTKPIGKKPPVKPETPVPTRFSNLPKLMEKTDILDEFRPAVSKPPTDNIHFRQMQESNPRNFGGFNDLRRPIPANSNLFSNNFMRAGEFSMPNHQMHAPQIYYNSNNAPCVTAAVPNVFNSQFNGNFAQPYYNRPIANPHTPNYPHSGPFLENSLNYPSKPNRTDSTVPYVNDLIDLTIPSNCENANIFKDKECPSSTCDMSSSISLLEGLNIDNGALEPLLDSDLGEDEEESSIEETSDSESECDEESSTSYASAHTGVQQSTEYVLLNNDNEILFQKAHEELVNIKTLEEFQKTSSPSLSSFPKNFEDFLLQFMEKSINEDTSENNVLEGEQNSSNATFNLEGNTNISDESVQDTREKTKRIRPTTSLGDWDYVKELPKQLPTDPKDQREIFFHKISSMSLSTNTNYLDFEVLRDVNNGAVINEVKILNGNKSFNSEFSKIPHRPSSVLMLDKGIMTSDIETSQVVVRDSGIDRLALMFPAVTRENLEELFDKCQKDIDWTAGLLLDSGQEMSELYLSLEPIECSNHDDNVPSPGSLAAKDTDIQQGEIKKQKRKKNDDPDKYKEIQEKIQSNFILGESHYSAKMKKHIERKHNIQIGIPTEVTSSVLPEASSSILDEEGTNFDNPTDSSDSEEDVVFMLDSDFIFQLQSRFGGLLRPNMISERTVVSMPSSLARQLHSYIMDSVLQQIEGEDIFTDDSIISKDEDYARQLQNEELKARGVPSLLEIMDEEVALRKTQVQKDSNNGKSMASTLSKQLLIERFPLMDPGTLASILEDTNHSLHEATCLLSSAGHFLTEPKEQTEQKTDIEEQSKNTLSREEAIKQADAYGDVASKLYELRKDCLKKSQDAYREGNPSVALYYSDMARWYMERIEKSNSLAAKAILSGYEGWTTLDLHFLQVSEALNVLDLFVDEVIRGLQESKDKRAIVYVITGRGLHSPGGRAILKPAVQSRLFKRDLRYVEQNPGMLRVTIPRTAMTSYNREVAACA